VLIRHQYAKTLDNAADILIKVLNKITRMAEKNLEQLSKQKSWCKPIRLCRKNIYSILQNILRIGCLING